MQRSIVPWQVVTSCALILFHFSAIIATSESKPFIIPAPITKGNEYSCHACINKLRGGAYYESNPNYQNSPATLGDVDKEGIYQATFQSPYQNNSQRQRPPPLTQVISSYFQELHKFSPTLFNGTLLSLAFFMLWQFPYSSSITTILRNHFVCSHYTVLNKKRFHALILSAFSHASFYHLAVNMYAYITFGKSVKPILASHGMPLWAFVLSAAIIGNLAFLVFDRGQGGSCVGLSGVTLALLAFDSLIYPTKELRMVVSFIPITLPAYYLFLGLLGVSVLGILGIVGRSNVAHSTHLGGLVYGALFYEAFKRGWVRLWSYRLRKALFALKRG